jgi:8-oxo-dGTP pyrophosphatase MutT (NUDIX family)
VAERDGRFLLVEELIEGRRVLNQPAGHLEEGESLEQAVAREVLEETAWRFHPEGVVGIYRWRAPASGETYIRFCFHGRVTDHRPDLTLDDAIVATRWLSADDLPGHRDRLRSPLVMRCIGDYRSGTRYPLALITDLG